MPNHLSVLGIIHTAISIIALIVALLALYSDGKIDPANGRGKVYVLLTVITCLTALPIMRTGQFTQAHVLAVLVLVLLPFGYYARSVKFLGKSGPYVQVFIMSSTLFFSFIPAIVETLTRLPISSPIASGPNDPIIQMGLLTLVLLFVSGVSYQLFKLKKKSKSGHGANISLN